MCLPSSYRHGKSPSSSTFASPPACGLGKHPENGLEGSSYYESSQSPEEQDHNPQLETVIANITLPPNKIQGFKIL